MACEHLTKLFELCNKHDLKISSSDVVRIKCNECEEIEVCPSMLHDEYEARGFAQVEVSDGVDDRSA